MGVRALSRAFLLIPSRTSLMSGFIDTFDRRLSILLARMVRNFHVLSIKGTNELIIEIYRRNVLIFLNWPMAGDIRKA
jgi:hypothetical protein